MQKFLIIQSAFLGDVILMTPIVSELHRLYPEAQIDVVVRKGNESLLQNNPKIHRLIVWNKKEHKYANLWKALRAIRQTRYDEVITLQRFTSAGVLTLFSKAKRRIGFDKNAFSWMYGITKPHSLYSGLHEVERNLSLIAHHGAAALVRPELFPSQEDEKAVKSYKEINPVYYCLAPASVWETKMLPAYKWIEIIKYLVTKGEVFLLGAPSDIELCKEIQSNFDAQVYNLAGKLSLLQSAALMKDAAMNFVNDSGPLHIASAMNAPTRAFFCSTVPSFGFGPLADNSKVIETKLNLDCRPCGEHGFHACPLGHFKCGHSIDVSPENLDI
ncbi:MAG: glycosyltransferase family 9 protein [Brumimicrobium sp.]|nr:glycosyltransferase family 9 protein [Brumimicrobium sp.]